MVGANRVCRPTETPAEIGPRGVRQMVILELPARENGVDEHETGLGTVTHRHRGRAIELDDGRGLDPQEHVVQSDDLPPIGRVGSRRLGRTAEAIGAYERASSLATQEPERRFLARRLRGLQVSAVTIVS